MSNSDRLVSDLDKLKEVLDEREKAQLALTQHFEINPITTFDVNLFLNLHNSISEQDREAFRLIRKILIQLGLSLIE